MTLDAIREALPAHARDLKLNLGSVLTPQGAPGLTETQLWSVAVASAIAARNPAFARAVEGAPPSVSTARRSRAPRPPRRSWA